MTDNAKEKAFELFLSDFLSRFNPDDWQETVEKRAEFIALISISAFAAGGNYEAQSAWQPIGTAPRDRDILGYCQETDECFVVWHGAQAETGDTNWVAFRSSDGTCVLIKDLSHWMPLPKAPS